MPFPSSEKDGEGGTHPCCIPSKELPNSGLLTELSMWPSSHKLGTHQISPLVPPEGGTHYRRPTLSRHVQASLTKAGSRADLTGQPCGLQGHGLSQVGRPLVVVLPVAQLCSGLLHCGDTPDRGCPAPLPEWASSLGSVVVLESGWGSSSSLGSQKLAP